MTLHAQAEVCHLEAMKVLNRDPVKEMTDKNLQVEHHQQSIDEMKVDINFNDYVLTSGQKEKEQQFLSGWSHIFSHGPTYLGRTKIIENKIHLTDKHLFKEQRENSCCLNTRSQKTSKGDYGDRSHMGINQPF